MRRCLKFATACCLTFDVAASPPMTVLKLADQLSQKGVLFDHAKRTEILGTSSVAVGSKTRIPGVVITDYFGMDGTYALTKIFLKIKLPSTMLADFESRFGRPVTMRPPKQNGSIHM